ncbi:MAG: hypothetical protein ACOYJV_02800 [Aminivibrio sp.]|jgi:Ethanolamine utilization protein EutJ (predicted chaperonin)
MEFFKWLKETFSHGKVRQAVEPKSSEKSPEEESEDSAQLKKSAENNHRPNRIQPTAKRPKPVTPRKAEKITIWVGLDFGTSFTKAAYRILGRNNLVYPLAMSEIPGMSYALPSLIAFDKNNVLFGDEADAFLSDKPWSEGVRYLKILFAGDLDDEFKDKTLDSRFREYCNAKAPNDLLVTPGYLTAAYLAWVIRKIKTSLERKFRGQKLQLNFHVCLPIDTIQKKAIKAEFQRALNVAVTIESQWDGKSGFELLQKAVYSWEGNPSLKDGDIAANLIPEAVAQMASYLTSLSVEKKIHGVIDLGAGTTDISVFNLGEDDLLYWYNAVTEPGGMEKVESVVAGILGKDGRPVSYPGLQQTMAKIAHQSHEIKMAVKLQLENIWENTRYSAWGLAYNKKRTESEWKKDKVKVFVCGGGSGLPFVEEVFGRCWHDESWGPYEVVRLYAPSNFKGRPEDFSRLSVAYGLTFPRPELAEYILPKDCPDHTPKFVHIDSERDGSWGAVYADNH